MVRGQEGICMLYFVAAVALCVHVRGAGANLNTVKRIVTLHWNQTNLIYITIHLKKSKYSNEPKNTLYFLFRLTAKHDVHVDHSLFHRPAAHAAAGQGEG